MKLKSTTLILLGLALILAGGVFWFEHQQSQTPDLEQPRRPKHFSFPPNQVQALSITQPTGELQLYRSGDNPQVWVMDQPNPVAVSPAAIEFLLNLLLESQSVRDFEVATPQLAEYGLANPQEKLVIQLVDGKTHRLLLGNPDFKGDALYALIDPVTPTPENVPVYLVSRSLQEMMRRSPQDWQKTESSSSPSPLP
ncbi:DUF4340 domain-containing protein [Synechocystis sp. LKSZ1]|uniref:DUF4340 domain-containing protein n=1 Tax=Synechocystis sp. LKSZ1 TaxID=3144951 RepID=UPI00336C206F